MIDKKLPDITCPQCGGEIRICVSGGRVEVYCIDVAAADEEGCNYDYWLEEMEG
jgi:hypothetical protein